VTDYFASVRQKPTPPPTHTLAPVNTGGATSYAAAALRSECEQVAGTFEGSRNAALNSAAFRMGRHIGAGNLDFDTARAALWDAGRACGLPDHEIQVILRDDTTGGLRNGAMVPRHPELREEHEAPAVTVLESVTTSDNTPSDIRERFPLLDWHELWNSEDEEEEWIIEPLLPARRLVALFSAPKVGKSLLMLEIAARVSQGAEVMGVTPARPYRVLYVDFENDPRGDVRTRLQAMGVKPGTLDNLCYLSYPTMAKLDTFMGAAELMAIVKEYECEVVVIDTISRAVQGEENENDTWLAFYRNTGLAMKQAGVACIRLDHTGKDHEKGMRGGSAKYGDVDAVWKLSKVADETYQLVCTDHRMKVPEDTIVLHREQRPWLTHRVAAEGREASYAAKVDSIIMALDQGNAEAGMGRQGARELLKSMGLHVKNDVLEEALRQRKQRPTVLS
jgi:hypothetical protein